jgi:hypothetical protein
VTEVVECSECGTPYDSQEHPFCPRCGSTAQRSSVPAAMASARRNDPSRRRVQASGAVLAAIGGLFLPFLGLAMALAPSFAGLALTQMHAGETPAGVVGGNLTVEVVDGGAPVPGVPVTLRHGNGTVLAEGATDGGGRFRAALGGTLTATVEVAAGNATFRRNATAITGSDTLVRVDVAADPPSLEGWVGAGPMVQYLRVFLGAMLAVSGLVLAAGVFAIRLRAWGFAVTGGIIGLLPFIVLFVASFALGALVALLAIGVPVVVIARGRRFFKTG